jgi:hypothetical protein
MKKKGKPQAVRRCGFGKGTFAGTHGSDGNAPKNEPARAGGSARLGGNVFNWVTRSSA